MSSPQTGCQHTEWVPTMFNSPVSGEPAWWGVGEQTCMWQAGKKEEKKTYGKLPLKCRLRLTMSSDLGIGRIFLSLLWCALRQWKRDAWGRRSKVNSFLLQQRWEAISKQKISPNHRPGWAGFIFSGADFYSPWAPVTPCTAPVNQSGEYSLVVQSICLPPDMEQLLWISHHSHPH